MARPRTLTDEERLERKREAKRRYREKYPEKIAEYRKKYYADNPDKKADEQRSYRDRYPDKRKELDASYRERNREMLKEKQRMRGNDYSTPELLAKHRKASREHARKPTVRARRELRRQFDINPPPELVEVKVQLLKIKRELKNAECE